MLGEIYSSQRFKQRGYGNYTVRPYITGGGFGDYIKKFGEMLVPMLKSSSKSIGNRVLKSGMNILGNYKNNKNQKSFKELLRDEKNNVIENFGNKTVKKIKMLTGGSHKKRAKRVKGQQKKKKNKKYSNSHKIKKPRRKKQNKKTDNKIENLRDVLFA